MATFLEGIIMGKTLAQKERYKRWLRKHPEKTIRQLRRWISKEKDPVKLVEAKKILKDHLERYSKKNKEN